ncbi:cytochrome c maturation protein CcmE [Myxococcota bacterium]|nr:cytochrome c maturation protein CcmE [Myxococcota bacterium]
MGSTIKIIVSLFIIGGAAAYLLASTMVSGDSLTYFHSADEVIAKPADFKDQRIRLGGKVEKGSILQKKGTLEYRFEVEPIPGMMKHPESAGKSITVAFTGIVPDTFKDDADVIVTGKLGADGTFQGTELIAKCPSKYEAADKNKGTY